MPTDAGRPCPLVPRRYPWSPAMTRRSSASSRPLSLRAAGLALSWTVTLPALAAGSGMPWEGPLQSILDSVQGPVAKIIAVIIIIATGLALAFGDTSGGFRKLIQIVFGLSIAFAASSFFLSFFSFAGGAVIG
uniref:TrbC/VirB2 family protein n=2 Tax=Stutzerimonas nitrititolerans TaxID=2482751 RepID=UPI0035E41148